MYKPLWCGANPIAEDEMKASPHVDPHRTSAGRSEIFTSLLPHTAPPAGQKQNLLFPLIWHLARRTCDMLRLHSACLHQEGLSSFERQDRLGLCRVSVEDLLKFSLLPDGWDAVVVGARLDAVDNSRCGLRSCGRVGQVSSCCGSIINPSVHAGTLVLLQGDTYAC